MNDTVAAKTNEPRPDLRLACLHVAADLVKYRGEATTKAVLDDAQMFLNFVEGP